MAISPTKKRSIAIKKNRQWLIIGGDASLRNQGKVIDRRNTKEETRSNRPLFSSIRPETDDEVIARLNLD